MIEALRTIQLGAVVVLASALTASYACSQRDWSPPASVFIEPLMSTRME